MNYKGLSFPNVINAGGKLTTLGVSKTSDEVADAMKFGMQHFFQIKKLHEILEKDLAEQLDVEDVYLTNSASASCALAFAGVLGKGSYHQVDYPYDPKYANSEILLQKGHSVNFGTQITLLIQLAGGKPVEAGSVNKCTPAQFEECINENTKALLYVKSHHSVQKSMLSIPYLKELSVKYHIPLIVDAAAEEDLLRYYNMGADVVIYSGGKALEGPCSGLVIGRRPYLDWMRNHEDGIGRPMKIGKENLMGLHEAITAYINRNPEDQFELLKEKVNCLGDLLNDLPQLHAKSNQDSAGRLIVRLEISLDKRYQATDLVDYLKEGDLQIFVREHELNLNKFAIDVRSVTKEELGLISDKIHHYFIK